MAEKKKRRGGWLWPRINDAASAKGAAIEGAVIAGLGAAVTAAIATANTFWGATFGVISTSAYVDALVFAVVAFGIWKMSRFAAVAGFCFYLIEAAVTVSEGQAQGQGIPMLIYTLGFVHAIRGTFAYRKFTVERGPAV